MAIATLHAVQPPTWRVARERIRSLCPRLWLLEAIDEYHRGHHAGEDLQRQITEEGADAAEEGRHDGGDYAEDDADADAEQGQPAAAAALAAAMFGTQDGEGEED